MISQYDKDDVEAVGLVKFDFLGLRNLTIIQMAVEFINALHSSFVNGSPSREVPIENCSRLSTPKPEFF